jgi:C-terminal processing protease CtpA/Prc
MVNRTRFFSSILLLLLTIGYSCGQPAQESLRHASVIERINDLMISYYVFPDVAEQTAAHLNKKLEQGTFDHINSSLELAEKLTEEVQFVNHDKHMRIMPRNRNSSSAIRTSPPDNGGFKNSSILEGNIGYIDMRGFYRVTDGAPAADRIMRNMEAADAIIIDLRKNGGGSPEMVQYLCSYFFDEKIHLNSLYWREGDRLQEFWTLDNVGGLKRPDVPLYILTSSYTFSGAEEFCYNMKTQNRATLIGEATGGGANPGDVMTINSELEIFIPTGRAINPVTKTNWEGKGVTPDIEVQADEALETALRLIRGF